MQILINKNSFPPAMAKRRKEKDEESDDKPFKAPKFDEEEFIKKEKRNIRVTMVSFLFGCFIALICFAFWALMGNQIDYRWTLVLLVAVANAVFLRNILEFLKIDISDFTKKNWFTNIAIYFFTWLLIMIVIVNPPFYDDESPRVELVVIPEFQELGSPVNFYARISDNAGIEKSGITFSIDGDVIDPSDYDFKNNTFTYSYEDGNILKTYNYSLTATDSNDLKTIKSGTFEYSNDSIYIPEPLDVTTPPGPRVGSATSIKFKVKDEVDRIYYKITNADNVTGEPINVTQKEGDFYITYPKYEGWAKNQNVTMQVYAEQYHYFEVVTSGQYCVISETDFCKNTITDSQTYYFTVADETGVSSEEAPKATYPQPKCVAVPGFETLLLIVALAAVILIFKYKKKDENK